MESSERPLTLDRVVRWAMIAGLVTFLVWLVIYLSDVLLPCAIAYLLAYLLNPLVNRLQRRVKNRTAAVVISFILFFSMLTATIAALLPVVTQELFFLADLLKAVIDDIEVSKAAANWLPAGLLKQLQAEIEKRELFELLQQRDFWAILTSLLRHTLPGLWGLVSGTTSILFSILGLSVVVLYLFFFLLDFEQAKSDWLELLPHPVRGPVLSFLREFDIAMSRYFRGQAVVASLVGVLFAIGFYLIGLPLGIVLGLLMGLMNMVPYLQLLGVLPVSLVAILQAVESNGDVGVMLELVALVFFVVQVIQDAVLVPRIMGEVTGLSPAMILLSISIWGKLLGILGLVIALPMTCLLLAYWSRLKMNWQKVKVEEKVSVLT